jgi:transcription elongation factor GreA
MAKYLTKEGLEKLKNELHQLETVGRKEMAERLKHAISFGDLSENAAYDEAREAQGFLEGKILELKGIISSAK